MKKIIYLFGICILFVACKKNDQVVHGYIAPGVTQLYLDNEQTFFIDSACVLIPNAFTPNGDGYNDYFYIVTKNVDSIHITVRDEAGFVVFSEAVNYWDGWIGSAPVRGFFDYQVFIRTTSGVANIISAKVFCSIRPWEDCPQGTVELKLGDMIDPNSCSFSYNTGEMFCL